MEVSEQIVVMNNARVEQIGAPRDLYENPANEFVMRFVGPVSELGGDLVRPHDIRILTEPEQGAEEAMIQRVVHLGFEVRVEFTTRERRSLSVQVTRQTAAELELEAGHIVWIKAQPEGAPALPSAA